MNNLRIRVWANGQMLVFDNPRLGWSDKENLELALGAGCPDGLSTEPATSFDIMLPIGKSDNDGTPIWQGDLIEYDSFNMGKLYITEVPSPLEAHHWVQELEDMFEEEDFYIRVIGNKFEDQDIDRKLTRTRPKK